MAQSLMSRIVTRTVVVAGSLTTGALLSTTYHKYKSDEINARLVDNIKMSKAKDITCPISDLRGKSYLKDNNALEGLFPNSILRIIAFTDMPKISSREIDVMSVSCDAPWDKQEDKQEEVMIRLTGQRKWGGDMFPSGWISNNILGRKYGRDDYSANNLPHAVIISDTSASNVDFIKEYCRKHHIPLFYNQSPKSLIKEIKRHYKSKLVATLRQNSYDKGYNNGSGQQIALNLMLKADSNEIYNRGYQDGIRANPLDKNAAIKQGYKKGAEDQFKEDKPHMVKDQEEIYQRGYQDGYAKGQNDERQNNLKATDAAYAKGLQEGLNTK